MVSYPELVKGKEGLAQRAAQRVSVSVETRVDTGLKGSSFSAQASLVNSCENREKKRKREP